MHPFACDVRNVLALTHPQDGQPYSRQVTASCADWFGPDLSVPSDGTAALREALRAQLARVRASVPRERPTCRGYTAGWDGSSGVETQALHLQDPVPIEFGVSVISTASRGPKRASSVEPFPPFLRTREHEPGR